MDSSSRKGLRSTLRPLVGISMHVGAFQDFQRTAICSPNAREMYLRCQAAVLIGLVQPMFPVAGARLGPPRGRSARTPAAPCLRAVKPLKYLRFILYRLLR